MQNPRECNSNRYTYINKCVLCRFDYLMTKDTEWVEVRRLIFKVAKLVCLPADVAKKRRV